MEQKELDDIRHSPAALQWDKIGIRPHRGINISLFSLHSARSIGIGEYLDLLPMIDWCASLEFDVIQLLPLNDTGLDTSPYSNLSAFALNPLHLSLHALPDLNQLPAVQAELKSFVFPPETNQINYPAVRDFKEKILRFYFKENGQKIIKSAEFQEFVSTSSWLKGYAIYKCLKIAFNWNSWESWPDKFHHPSTELLDELIKEYQEEVHWHQMLQFLCHLQLAKVKEYAKKHSILMKGDIPFLINRDSADVWLYPNLFDLRYSAGSPPDMYSEDGQKWGFPLYRWEEMAKDQYHWWIERLKYASNYYDLYRLDHIVGFFRIWAVPIEGKAKEGFYLPSNPFEWIPHGKAILRVLLDHSEMLPIGEDLGTIPPAVRVCLKTLGISGTKVMRWERYWDEDKRFIPLDEYPLLSMTTVSTHDSETVSQWWQNHPDEVQQFANFKGWCYTPKLSREHLFNILWDSYHTTSLFHVNLLQELVALVPGMIWHKIEDERINIPGICNESNWSYRFRPSVEEITSNLTLAHAVRELIL